MRSAPLKDEIQGADRKDEIQALGKVGDAARGLPARHRRERSPFEKKGPAGDRQNPRDDLEQSGLARAVLSQKGRDLSPLHGGIQSPKGRRRAVLRAQAAGLQDRAGCFAHWERSSSQAKSGAPRAAVTAPIGSSAGAKAALANASAATSSAAPDSAETGSRTR